MNVAGTSGDQLGRGRNALAVFGENMGGKLMPQAEKQGSGNFMNALSGVGSALAYAVAPEAYERGRRYKYRNEFADSMASGNYDGAAQSLYQMGDYQGGMSVAGYGERLQQQKQQSLSEQQRKTLETANSFVTNMLTIPVEGREAFARANWSQMEALAPGSTVEQFIEAQGGDLSDAAFADDLALLRSHLGEAPPEVEKPNYFAPVQVQGADGQTQFAQFNNQGGDPRIMQGVSPMASPDAQPKTQKDAFGRLRYVNGPNAGGIVPGFNEVAPRGNGVTIGMDANGNPIVQVGGSGALPQGRGVGGAGSRYQQSSDVKQLEAARKAGADAQGALSTLKQARSLLVGADGQFSGTGENGENFSDDNYATGPYAGMTGQASRFTGGLLGGGRQKGVDYESAVSLSKDLGIEKLRALGGNDTERELLTSIQTTFGPDKLPETNLAILDRQIAVMEIVALRAPFLAKWQQAHGSTYATDEQGRTYDQALQEFQRSEAERRGLLSAGSNPVPQRAIGRGDVSAMSDAELLATLGVN